MKFVDALISNTKGEGKEGDPFWTKAETLLYCALIAYIIFEGPAEDRNMNTLVDMISGMEVKEDNENFMNAVDYMFKGLEKRKPDCFAVKQYKKYKLASGKTAKSILISCGSRLAPFDIPQLREIMAYDELQLDRIGDRKTAVFFTISDTTPTYNFLVALAFSQMFNLLCERADNVHGGRLPHHVRVLWDEAANTGQVPQLEKLVAVIRSREISLTLFYQQMAQCKAIYDKHAETILGNMDSVVFLGGRESSTIKEISENWLGKATIYMQTDGRSKGQSESYNQNTQRLGRELMTPAELATMPGDRCILQLRGLPPFYSPKYDLKQHPNYKYGRMLEIYILTSLAPIPMATISHREVGQIGQNYLRSLFAVGFQGMLILVCVAIYAVLIQGIATGGDPIGAIWGIVGYTVLLCFMLFKTGSIARSIFNAH